MQYLYLGLAIVFEVVGSGFMKASHGFTKLVPAIIVAVSYLVCFYFLSLSLKTIPLGTAYAIWAGLGIVLTSLVSFLVFKQAVDIPTIAGIVLIVAGVFVINFYSKAVIH